MYITQDLLKTLLGQTNIERLLTNELTVSNDLSFTSIDGASSGSY